MARYIFVNHDTAEYLQPASFGESDSLESILTSSDGVLQGLAFLLRASDEGGGGDIDSDSSLMGHWAGDRISLVSEDVEVLVNEIGYSKALREGTDLSAQVRQALVEALGEESCLAFLNPALIPSLEQQRELSSIAMQYLFSEDARKKPLPAMEKLFAVLGGRMGLSIATATSRLQQALAKSREIWKQAEVPLVQSVRFSESPTELGSFDQLVVKIEGQAEQVFVFGEKGHSAADVLGFFFPGIHYESLLLLTPPTHPKKD